MIGQTWEEVSDGGLWQVAQIEIFGRAKPGKWPRLIRNVRLVRVGSASATSADGGRWMRERNLLTCFRIAPLPARPSAVIATPDAIGKRSDYPLRLGLGAPSPTPLHGANAA